MDNSLSLERQYTKLSNIWDGSLQKHALLRTLQRKVLTKISSGNESIHIDSAMCLGLGNIDQRLLSLDIDAADMRVPSDLPESWEDEVSSSSSDDEFDLNINPEPNASPDPNPNPNPNPNPKIKHEKPHNRLNTTRINPILYQLIIFETTIEVLRSKFTLPNSSIRFQDPQFSLADVTFLTQKGYTVLPYPSTLQGRKYPPIDPTMLEYITPATFVFARALNIAVFAEVLCATRPGLVLSEDPLLILGFPVLVCHLLPSLERFCLLSLPSKTKEIGHFFTLLFLFLYLAIWN